MQHSGEYGVSVSHGAFGFVTSQMCDDVEPPWSAVWLWKRRLQYATASFLPSPSHDMRTAVRFTGLGSLNTVTVFTDGGPSDVSAAWSAK